MVLIRGKEWTAEDEEGLTRWLSKATLSNAHSEPSLPPPQIREDEPGNLWKDSNEITEETGHHSDLPNEILFQILSYVPRNRASQPTLYAAALVSRSWYFATVPALYHTPYITGKNFKSFTNTICPSINLHIRKSALADLVRTLDMSHLVHEASKSLTARLLGRVKSGLVEFVAPQSSFAVNSLAAISKCKSLRHLDLSLVSEALMLSDLFHSISQLANLESFRFPRSSVDTSRSLPVGNPWPTWPPNLKELHISGGIHDSALLHFATVPLSIAYLTIENAPHLSLVFINQMAKLLGPQLHSLKINFHLPKLSPTALDGILKMVPNLKELHIAADYISSNCFDYISARESHPLEMLTVDCFEPPPEHKILPMSLFTVVERGGLGRLRRVRVHEKLGWMTGWQKEDVELLSDLMEALEREEVEEESDPTERIARISGVWWFGGRAR